MKLTALEKQLLVASIAFWNYGTEDEKFDNAVVFDVKDLKAETGLALATIKGGVGSLFKKGLFCAMECGELGQNIEIGITDEGIDAALASAA